MKLLVLVILLLGLSACAHHAPKVDCERHLVPINPPNPVKTTREAPANP